MHPACDDPVVTTPPPAAPGRREINKARTRQALIDAARALGREHGLERVTAEEIAERAGVSRRTFFNYFSSIEAVVAAGLAEPLARLAAALHDRPPDEDPLLAMVQALRSEPVGAEILLGWEPEEPSSTAQRQMLHTRIWQHHREWLVGLLHERLGDDDGVRVTSLAAAVMAIFEVVQEQWQPAAARQPSALAVADFNTRLVRALCHARSGWQQPTHTI